ncbi:hypothetical protein Tsubulata_006706 [Turnera subulata]|uniref:RING-type domain-containing protein n=1 Tax=Turnera subulata TaxID=218843 RepID=A0A9Q0JQE2_9ROSI|nr:hypothetical protein Tsubulata_006706 [Turnera subulata]
MVSDSISANASIPSATKDFGKKKRANRSAKLKQCKLDARREQWLSQGVAKNKGIKEEPAGPRGSPPLPGKGSERKHLLEKLEMRRRDEDENGSIHHDFDSDSPSNSPTGSSVLGGSVSGTNFTGSSSSSSSSSSSGGCCSGSITEDDEDNCLDDWEAVADALAADDENKQGNCHDDNSPCLESGLETHRDREPVVRLDSHCEALKRSLPNSAPMRVAPANSRAWRPDDECRPQSLPNLAKQRSLPNADRHCGQGGFQWDYPSAGAVNGPSSCPVCTEDLDFTDASFLPCSCRFQVCLFCYKKMLELDGRCPNCRKLYEHVPAEVEVEVEASVHGGSLTLKLPRSYSMIARS